jgi:hypothetical protein
MCLRFVFLLITRLAAWLRLSRREEAWQTAEILILRHQLAVLQRQQPRRPNLDWADRALIAALAGRGVRPDSLDRLRLSDRRPLAQSALVLLGAVGCCSGSPSWTASPQQPPGRKIHRMSLAGHASCRQRVPAP